MWVNSSFFSVMKKAKNKKAKNKQIFLCLNKNSCHIRASHDPLVCDGQLCLVLVACHIRRATQHVIQDWFWLASFIFHIWQFGGYEGDGEVCFFLLFSWYLLISTPYVNCRNMDLENNKDSQGTDERKTSRWAVSCEASTSWLSCHQNCSATQCK